MSLSANIKRLRNEKNMTQEQLASALGVTAQAVSKWETSETYPDGALLVPLSKALGASLDELFDNDRAEAEDISKKIIKLIKEIDEPDRFDTVRDICWQIQRALFNCYMPLNEKYSPDDVKSRRLSSFVSCDQGFTLISNGREPFFSAFFEPQGSFGYFLESKAAIQKIFSALSSNDTLDAIIFLYRQNNNYIFEASVLARECRISAKNIQKVISDLKELNIIYEKEMMINGKSRTLYHSIPDHTVIALFLITKELTYRGGHCLTANKRKKPYIK